MKMMDAQQDYILFSILRFSTFQSTNFNTPDQFEGYIHIDYFTILHVICPL